MLQRSIVHVVLYRQLRMKIAGITAQLPRVVFVVDSYCVFTPLRRAQQELRIMLCSDSCY